jgi:hypothetical protein
VTPGSTGQRCETNGFAPSILGFRQEYIKAGTISYGFTEIELNEPDIGIYLAKRMDIKIGKQSVSLVPLGTMLIGCKGRVDAQGPAGHAQIFFVNEKVRRAADLITVTVSVGGKVPPSPRAQKPASWVWKILTTTVEKRFVDLDKDSFFALLMEIANA